MSVIKTCISRFAQSSHALAQKRLLPSLMVPSLRTNYMCTQSDSIDNERRRPSMGMKVIKLRGLPYKATKDDIINFIGDENLVVDGKDGVFVGRGLSSWSAGLAVFRLKDEAGLDEILKKNGDYMGNRFIEVSLDEEEELNTFKYENSLVCEVKNTVQLSGLPYKIRPEDVVDFLEGIEIEQNGIIFGRSEIASRNGRCYVVLKSEKDVELALKKDRECIRKRFILIKEADPNEYLQDTVCMPKERVAPQNNHIIVKGLPWSVTKEDIEKFFEPLEAKEIYIETYRGRPTGIGHVIFNSLSDKLEGLKKHKHAIGARFIEVYTD